MTPGNPPPLPPKIVKENASSPANPSGVGEIRAISPNLHFTKPERYKQRKAPPRVGRPHGAAPPRTPRVKSRGGDPKRFSPRHTRFGSHLKHPSRVPSRQETGRWAPVGVRPAGPRAAPLREPQEQPGTHSRPGGEPPASGSPLRGRRRRRRPGSEVERRGQGGARRPVLTGCSGRCTRWRWSRYRRSAPRRCSS